MTGTPCRICDSNKSGINAPFEISNLDKGPIVKKIILTKPINSR